MSWEPPRGPDAGPSPTHTPRCEPAQKQGRARLRPGATFPTSGLPPAQASSGLRSEEAQGLGGPAMSRLVGSGAE